MCHPQYSDALLTLISFILTQKYLSVLSYLFVYMLYRHSACQSNGSNKVALNVFESILPTSNLKCGIYIQQDFILSS
jgi:hypothetical protein